MLDAEYMFYNSQMECLLSYGESWYLICAPNARITTGHPFGWDFEAIAAYELYRGGDSAVETGKHGKVNGSDKYVPVEASDLDQVMADGNESGFQIVVNGAVVTASASVAVGSAVRVVNSVSPTDGMRSECNAGSVGSASGNVSEYENDFQLMNVSQFLTDAGGEILECVLEGSYEQPVSCIHGRRDQ